jgi:hypothetical protein
MNPKFFWLIIIIFVFVVLISPAKAQQPEKIPRIGYLLAGFPSGSSEQVAAFRRGLRELGYERAVYKVYWLSFPD